MLDHDSLLNTSADRGTESDEKNIFVLGLTEVQRDELQTVHGARRYRFHDLLDYETLVDASHVEFQKLLDAARRELDAFGGSVDAIVSHWDFPTSVIGPILAKERGLPAPSLESLLKCEHKYWSRLEQHASVPECVPRFAFFDPFDDDAFDQIDLPFPFWVKPVKSHSSNLGFEIRDRASFDEAVAQIREEIEHIGNAFNAVLDRVDVPPELQGAGGNTCLAEQLISGIQVAPEGTVFRGEFAVHGIFDMHRDAGGTSIERIDYPASSVPSHVQERMTDILERYLRRVGFDDACFNGEFMWDDETDDLWLIEVNTRISQSHSEMFVMVDGASNHEVAIDIALGHAPRLASGDGEFRVASQCMIFHDDDATVTRIPTTEEVADLERRHPWCDGAVGMMGISWGGFNSLQVAARRPPALKAIIAASATEDLYVDNMHYMGGCLLTDNLSEATVMFAFNSLPPDPAIVGDRWRDMWRERLEGSGLWIETWLRHQRRDEYWKPASVSENYSDIQCPVFAVGGWADGYTNAVFRLMEHLEVPRKGLIGPWGHKYPHLGVPGPAIGFLQEVVRWWDHWLKGIDTGLMDEPMLRAWMQDSVPPATSYDTRPGRWVAERSWPAAAVRERRYVLDRHALEQDGAAIDPGHDVRLQSPLSVGMFAGKWASYAAVPDLPFDQREEDGGALVYETEPLDAPLEIFGLPSPDLEITPLEDGEHAWRVTRDLATDVSKLEVLNDQGSFRIDETDTVVRRDTSEWYTFQRNDVNSVRGETRTVRRYERDDWRIEVLTRTVLTSTPEEFHVNAELDAYELDAEHGDSRFFADSWQLSVPRDLV